MAKTTFVDRQTKIVAEWLNEVNVAVFDAIGDGTNAPTTAAEVLTNIGAGDVVGPAVSTNNNVAVFDQTTGKLIKDGGATLASKANSGTNSDITSATALASLPVVTSGSVFRKNAIINGDFQVWQEGTSFVAMANGQYVADNWKYVKSGVMIHTGFQSADVPTIVQAGRKIPYSILIDCTTVDAAIAAGDLCALATYVEGYNFVNIAGVGLCLQFWHKHTKTGTYCVSFSNTGNDRSFVREYTQDVTDTWELATVLVDASPSAGTWNYTNGIGLQVWFTIAAGTDFQGVASSWNSAQDYATANQVNACDSTSNNFMLAGVQLEKGSVATEFDTRPFAIELEAAKRYYQKTFRYTTAPAQNAGYAGAMMLFSSDANGNAAQWWLPVAMRAIPTITTYNPIAANASWRDLTNSVDRAVLADPNSTSTEETVVIQLSASAATAAYNYIHITASARF